MKHRTILITESDTRQLRRLVDSARWSLQRELPYIEQLEEELDRAEVVAAEDIPQDVVTMNSQVRVLDMDARKETVYTLVFPPDADISRNRISVLAPIGTALLGYRVGDVIEWQVPAGMKRLRIEEILYQPEAVGVLDRAVMA